MSTRWESCCTRWPVGSPRSTDPTITSSQPTLKPPPYVPPEFPTHSGISSARCWTRIRMRVPRSARRNRIWITSHTHSRESPQRPPWNPPPAHPRRRALPRFTTCRTILRIRRAPKPSPHRIRPSGRTRRAPRPHTPGTPGIPGVPDFPGIPGIPGIPAPWGAPLRHRHPGARVR